MKKLLLAVLASLSFAGECQIITSPIDYNKMDFGYSSWLSMTTPIVSVKENFKFTSFVDAYDRFDKEVRTHIRDVVCKKNKWDGVVNYKITWQQTKDTYVFVATYDAFAYK